MDAIRQSRISFKTKGLTLEGTISYPDGIGGQLPCVLLCHPEPHLGGTMDSPVIQSLTRGLNQKGFFTLRFNYRGVGESTGKYSMGVGEMEDTLAALKLLREWPGADKGRVAIVGYSFGAGIAVRVAQKDKKLLAAVAVSPPLTLPPVGLQGVVKELGTFDRPLLVLIGEKDGLTPPKQLEEWVKTLSNPLIRMVSVPEANRAWQGHGRELTDHVVAFVRETLAA